MEKKRAQELRTFIFVAWNRSVMVAFVATTKAAVFKLYNICLYLRSLGLSAVFLKSWFEENENVIHS
jgi:hypothetical protein